MSDTDFYEVIESQRAVVFQNKEKTVLIVVTDFRKLSEIVRKYVNIVESVGHYQNTSLKLNTKVTQRLLIKYQIISDLQCQTRN